MGIKLGGVGNLFKGGGKIPDFKPSAPKPDLKPSAPKPDAKPQFTPRPDINGKPQLPKPDAKPQFSPRPDINGNLPDTRPNLNRPNFNGLDNFKPNGLNNLKPNGLGNGLGAAGDVFGGLAQGAAGLAGAGLDAASTLGMMGPGPVMDPYAAGGLPPELGMMGPGPVMDPYAAGGLPPELGMMGPGPVMDPYAAGGLPPELGMMGPGPVMDPYAAGGLPPAEAMAPTAGGFGGPAVDGSGQSGSGLSALLDTVANAVSTVTQVAEAVTSLVDQASGANALPTLAKTVAEAVKTPQTLEF
ncbi:hypothetical protein [Stigmatella aurantiaca]|uniref:Surface protein PspC n=1 Tax=Stigmatella aurantiaca (strain DW4/3-1) TaxID=378806 RepID=Q098V6_STIAD|nr:hypothetical protein [Stigmatella aurantiaca]ADO75498.1 uncharacterized protein STAUR_7743 [Stigmatella aurantiaca DW4/3-1]EAU68268.1 surface protein PspC [Stigmatella aurantiaca DW4/3-1]